MNIFKRIKTVLTKTKPKPLDYDMILPIENIQIPQDFILCPPNPNKLNKAIKYLKTYKQVDEPILVYVEDFLDSNHINQAFLIDGYTRYLASCNCKKKNIPVKLIHTQWQIDKYMELWD